MAVNQIKHFERWRQKTPENTAYFIARVVDEIVPLFLERGYGRYADYAAGSTFAVGANCIPLQRRSGSQWPTVEILFHRRGAPSLGVNFASLPEICQRHTTNGTKDIPRIEACVVEGPAFFSLCKGKSRNLDCNFGNRWFALRPKRKLDEEIAVLKLLLPWLFGVLEEGIPEAWYAKNPGYVDQHAFLSRASRIFRDA